MNTTTTTVDQYDHVAAAEYLMKHAGTTALAVLDGQHSDRPIGCITETDIAEAMAGGLSNPAIASALFISVPTVKTHVSHILTKLGLDSRVQLASWVAGHDLGPATPARE